jgi:hypothetical protein
MALRSGLTWILLSMLALAGCAGPAPDTHREFVDQTLPASEIAIVRSVSAEIRSIDGARMKHPDSGKYYAEIHLPPGRYEIVLYRMFGVSALLRLKGYIEVISEPLVVELESGHIYSLYADRTTGDPDIGVALWIEDTATGEVIARSAQPREF